MGIFDRMGKVISSNMNSLLDKAEDDGKLLELNLEEMAAQLKRGRQDVVQAVAAEKQLRKKADDLEAEVATWEKRAELALKGGDEELAREALK
ncbi:MAG: PspA/IM30 family protein, partial [Proteobacteria bacterium]